MEKKKENKQIEKKKEIIKAAKISVLENGYKKTNIEGIMKSINSSKGSFYNSFKNKEELLNEILDEVLNDIEERNNLFIRTTIEFEKRIMEGIKISFYLDEARIFDSLFLINLTNNIEVLNEKIRNKLILIKKEQNNFWIKIIKEGLESQNITTKRDVFLEYGRLISNIVFNSFRRIVLYSNDANFYITSLKIAEKKIESEETKNEIKFLYGIIIKILQGEKRK